MSVATSIAPWGNSEAVRIPKSLLRSVGLAAGDKVRIAATDRGSIEIVPLKREHRRVQPKRGVTFEALFADFGSVPPASPSAWPSDAMVGAELEAWS